MPYFVAEVDNAAADNSNAFRTLASYIGVGREGGREGGRGRRIRVEHTSIDRALIPPSLPPFLFLDRYSASLQTLKAPLENPKESA